MGAIVGKRRLLGGRAVNSVVETDVPARLDRLALGRFHVLVIAALGVTWMLDGLEVTIVGSLGSVLEERDTLALSAGEVGGAGTAYIAGAIVGAIVFGHLADRHGRKKLFLTTLGLYVAATFATALSTGFPSFIVCRFFTGMGIGGEYAAINSAIDELIPARVRGTVDLGINGGYWIGTAFGAAASGVLLESHVLSHDLGWRATFALGGILALGVVLLRRFVPESPRWLMVHGRQAEADAIVQGIEARCARADSPGQLTRIRLVVGTRIGFRRIASVMFSTYRSRALLGVSLMTAQAFFYNSIFFTYSLTLTHFYGVSPEQVWQYLLPFALGNLTGPLVLGHLFDSVGRKTMIAVTYAVSGAALLMTGVLFRVGALNAFTQTLAWSVAFFFASAAASSAYLTVSEIFPLEIRALAIALFYAVGTGVGGLVAPALFGALIQTGSRNELFIGYAIGAALMTGAAAVALVLGVAAEGRALEDVALPLSTAPSRPDGVT